MDEVCRAAALQKKASHDGASRCSKETEKRVVDEAVVRSDLVSIEAEHIKRFPGHRLFCKALQIVQVIMAKSVLSCLSLKTV